MNDDDTKTREAKLDSMLSDSFPASDPPSFTPVVGMGCSTPEGSPSDHMRHGVKGDRRSGDPADRSL